MRLKLLLLALPFAVGCSGLFQPDMLCDEYRNVEVHADLVGSAGEKLADVMFRLTEDRDSTRSFVDLKGTAPSADVAAPLRGHIAKLRILSGAGAMLVSPKVEPVAAFDPNIVLFFTVTYGLTGAGVADLRQRMLAGDIRLEVTTDESPARVFTLTPHVTDSPDWQKVYCK